MTRYHTLLNVLDQLRAEAPPEFKSYHPDESEVEAVRAARSRAFIHLLLKVRFGIIEFQEREDRITEGADDGGIDAYFIDPIRKTVYFIQSKFRQTERNFEEKVIEPEELLCMDINRVLDGETASAAGVNYSSKIQAMMRQIRSIQDIARFSYHVIILANAKGVTRAKLQVLTGGFQAEIVDFKECYSKLLFPLVSGTYYTADELRLALTLSNKNAGAKISYTVQTEHAKIEITVVFVPTLEIAKTMFKYRNSILRFNPRSYLEHEGQSVNAEIRRSIEKRTSNEFALFNNGITILSDETYLNEKIGQKDRAQLTLVNPQIINGGQTAYTLSQIYKDHSQAPEQVFGDKEVLVKIITLDASSGLTEGQKLHLIESISKATNSQTAVTNADRRSNEPHLQELQIRSFIQLGLFLERKRGEFADGIREGYLHEGQIVDRNTFLRCAMLAQGKLKDASIRKLAARCNYQSVLEVSDEAFREYRAAMHILKRVRRSGKGPLGRVDPGVAARAHACLILMRTRKIDPMGEPATIGMICEEVMRNWRQFLSFCEERHATKPVFKTKGDSRFFDLSRYLHANLMPSDIGDFFGSLAKGDPVASGEAPAVT